MAETTRDPAEIRAGIERAREEIERSMAALRDEVHQSVDWRRYVRRHPGAFFAGALAVGALVARATSRR
jgi:hypothetical protein